MTIECEDDIEIINIIKRVSGIQYFVRAYVCKSNIEDIFKCIKENLTTKEGTFKVKTKRVDKNFNLQSNQVNMELGGMILEEFKNLKVDIHNPQTLINVEIKRNQTILFFDKIKGIGGFPLGINKKILMLISGGIDSPVASNLLIKKGYIVDFITFVTPPHTNEKALDKVRKLVKVLTKDLYEPKLYVCNFTNIQHELSHMSVKAYQITLMRRFFFRIARDLAKKEGYLAIATGESIGQVASQTTESMQTIQNAIGDFLVLRPLLTFDKSEIIEIAKNINTYDISIEPYADCCALFVPTNPVTKPTIHLAEKLESELPIAFGLYEKILDKIKEEK